MFNIRKGIFETNSSSTHSLVINKNAPANRIYEVPKNSDGSITIQLGEYGWEVDILSTVIEKLSYFVTQKLHTTNDKELYYIILNKTLEGCLDISNDNYDDYYDYVWKLEKEIEEKIKHNEFENDINDYQILPREAISYLYNNSSELRELFNILKQDCGISEIHIAFDSCNYNVFGYIDHQSIDLDYTIDDVFNVNTVIVTGNDNDYTQSNVCEHLEEDKSAFDALQVDNMYKIDYTDYI